MTSCVIFRQEACGNRWSEGSVAVLLVSFCLQESKEKMELMKQFMTALHVKQRLERAIDWKGWNPVPEKEGEEPEKKAEADACDKKCKAHEETNGSR